MLQVINEALSLTLATAIGFRHYRLMSPFFKALFMQLIVWDFFYLFSYAITIRLSEYGLTPNNSWWLNAHMPFETGMLALAAYAYFDEKKPKYLLLLLYAIFLCACILLLSMNYIDRYNNYAAMLQGLLITLFYSVILYRVFTDPGFSWQQHPEIWVCTGLIIYFACNTPYMSAFNYLNKFHRGTSLILFRIITDVLANIRYFLLAFAFWQLRRQAVSNAAITYG